MARKASDAKRVRSHEMLPVPLTDDELLAHADRAARLQGQADHEAEALRDEMKERRAEIEELRTQAREALRLVRERREDRRVEVEVVYEYAANAVVLVRLDTGEQVRQRPMTADERQEALFKVEGAKK